MSWALIPARLIASRAARTANCEVYSSGAAFRRCLMPVRVVIHSSDVSTIFSRSAFVRTPSGYEWPVPRIPAFTLLDDTQKPFRNETSFRSPRPRDFLNGSINSSGVLFHLNDFAAFVVAALRTHTMLHAWLLTVWTGNRLRCAQSIMRTALTRSCF